MKTQEKTDLIAWTVNYVKNRDLAFRKLKSHKEHKDHITFEFKDKTVEHFVMENLSDELFSKIKDIPNKAITTTNTEDNFKYLIKNWKKLSDVKNLTIIFVSHNDKWVICPHTHAMIADPESIESGLRTIFDTANGKVTEPKVTKKKASMFEDTGEEEDGEEE